MEGGGEGPEKRGEKGDVEVRCVLVLLCFVYMPTPYK